MNNPTKDSSSTSSSTAPFELIVIGAGPGGLTAARCAQLAGFNVTVYEREPSLESRDQGGTLDLHTATGQWAVQKAGLMEEFKLLARQEGQELKIADKQGNLVLNFPSNETDFSRPEIDRRDLRQMLVESLKPDTIHWGWTLGLVESRGDAEGQHSLVLHFDNGQCRTLSNGILIGADGAWSRVRPLLTPAKPLYSGVTFLDLCISNVVERHPEVSRTVGRGSMFAYADSKAILAQMNSDGRLRIYLAFRQPEGSVLAELGGADASPDTKRNLLLAKFYGWAEWLLDIIRACDDEAFIERAINTLPTETKWASQPNVTLIGDAAHLMSPFSGAGANLAMKDGAGLVKELAREKAQAELKNRVGDQEWVRNAIQRHEEKMMGRARRELRVSNFAMGVVISPNAERNVRRVAPVAKGIYAAITAAMRLKAAVKRQ